MKRWQIIAVIVTSLVAVGLAGCSTVAGGGETANQQLSEVRKGTLSVSVSGTGNIEPSEEAWLTFGSNGRIGKIYVEEGDPVSEGEILAQLDTNTLELAKAQAELDLTQAKVALTKAKLAVTQAELSQKTAEYDLDNVLDQQDELELALFNAQIDVDQAKYNLEQVQDLYTWTDIKIAQANVDEAEDYLDYAMQQLYKYLPEMEEGVYPKIEDDFPKLPGFKEWQDRVIHAQARLNSAKDQLEAMQSNRDTEETAIKRKRLEAAELAEGQAQKNLDELNEDIALQELQVNAAKNSVEQARESVELAQQSVKLAQQSLKQAQKNLDEATITAPFAGVIANVIVKEGDMVPSPNVSPMPIIQLVNYDRMELLVEMDEIDIPGVVLNQKAIISVDALPGVNFEGRVTSIYPTPTVVGGVVLYKTKISFDVPEDSGIKVGMSAIADIIVSKKENVVLVPKQAIEESEQGETQVGVIINGKIRKKPVVIGMSDGLYTEILSGVSEGESVLMNIAR